MASQFIEFTYAMPTRYCDGGGRIIVVVQRIEMARRERQLKEGTT
jgi:hypothetical protein